MHNFKNLILATSLALFTACSGPDGAVNFPQSVDMATEGEQDLDIVAEAAINDMDPSERFDDYADKYLSELRWVARDGSIKRSPQFEVNYKKVRDFKAISDIPERKAAFFDYMRPAIDHQNQLIRERRQILKGIQIKLEHDLPVSPAQEKYLTMMRERYRVPVESTRAEAVAMLLRRVDTLPVSMVLSQAAIESGWGTSRFARVANNLFGQWCYKKGCGIVPNQRTEGAKHEIASFPSVDRAIGAYFLNVNAHPSYLSMRDLRENLRTQSKPLSGYAMVAGLEKYSSRGLAYVKEVRHMIRSNKLE